MIDHSRLGSREEGYWDEFECSNTPGYWPFSTATQKLVPWSGKPKASTIRWDSTLRGSTVLRRAFACVP